ncbi:MAG TPA: hypothetical protein ENG73_06400, partial [Desulfobacterales bacterium]|nr:hypothetical protein [Desulfobacterales bacterium]
MRGNVMIITGNDYIERLAGYKRDIFVKGEKIQNFVEHPNIRPAINAIA